MFNAGNKLIWDHTTSVSMANLFRIQLVYMGSPSQKVKSQTCFFSLHPPNGSLTTSIQNFSKKYILALLISAFERFWRFDIGKSKSQMTWRIENPMDSVSHLAFEFIKIGHKLKQIRPLCITKIHRKMHARRSWILG